jgi:hypothetical protein
VVRIPKPSVGPASAAGQKQDIILCVRGGGGAEIPSTVDVWTLLRVEVYTVYSIVVLMCANMMRRPNLLILVRHSRERVMGMGNEFFFK